MKAAVSLSSSSRVILVAAAFILLLGASPVLGAASDVVVDELFSAIDAERNAHMVRRAVANYMDSLVHDALSRLNLSATQNRRIKRQIDAQTRGLLDEIRWEKIKPLYVAVYREEFTDEELKAVIAYYKSPAGRKFRERQDALNQGKTRITKELLADLQPKLKEVVDRITADAKASPDAEESATPPDPQKEEPGSR